MRYHNLHPRVLQKRLKSEGTSFTRLLQEPRQDIACQHLQHDNIGITDLVLKLGYASDVYPGFSLGI